MRHSVWAAVVGLLVVHVGAAQPPAPYVPPAGFAPAQYWGNGPVVNSGFGHALTGSCGTCGEGACDSGRSRDRLGRLFDFLFYRPTPGCDCCPKVTSYVPPLHAWFPPCCHANGGNGCATCSSKWGFRKGQHNGCATCEGVAGTPVHTAAVKPEVVESKLPAALPMRPVSFSPPTMVTRPQPTVAVPAPAPTTRYWMPGVQSTRPVNAAQSQPNQSNSGYNIQPSRYLPPLPQQR